MFVLEEIRRRIQALVQEEPESPEEPKIEEDHKAEEKAKAEKKPEAQAELELGEKAKAPEEPEVQEEPTAENQAVAQPKLSKPELTQFDPPAGSDYELDTDSDDSEIEECVPYKSSAHVMRLGLKDGDPAKDREEERAQSLDQTKVTDQSVVTTYSEPEAQVYMEPMTQDQDEPKTENQSKSLDQPKNPDHEDHWDRYYFYPQAQNPDLSLDEQLEVCDGCFTCQTLPKLRLESGLKPTDQFDQTIQDLAIGEKRAYEAEVEAHVFPELEPVRELAEAEAQNLAWTQTKASPIQMYDYDQVFFEQWDEEETHNQTELMKTQKKLEEVEKLLELERKAHMEKAAKLEKITKLAQSMVQNPIEAFERLLRKIKYNLEKIEKGALKESRLQGLTLEEFKETLESNKRGLEGLLKTLKHQKTLNEEVKDKKTSEAEPKEQNTLEPESKDQETLETEFKNQKAFEPESKEQETPEFGYEETLDLDGFRRRCPPVNSQSTEKTPPPESKNQETSESGGFKRCRPGMKTSDETSTPEAVVQKTSDPQSRNEETSESGGFRRCHLGMKTSDETSTSEAVVQKTSIPESRNEEPHGFSRRDSPMKLQPSEETSTPESPIQKMSDDIQELSQRIQKLLADVRQTVKDRKKTHGAQSVDN